MNKFEGFLFVAASSALPGLATAVSGHLVKEFGLPDIDFFKPIDQEYLSADYIQRGEFAMIAAPSIVLLVGFFYLMGALWHDNAHKSINENGDH